MNPEEIVILFMCSIGPEYIKGWISDIWRTSGEEAPSDQLPSRSIGLEHIPSQFCLFSEELIQRCTYPVQLDGGKPIGPQAL